MKYEEPGEYTLTYTATDSCGNTATESRQITVEEPSEILLATWGATNVPIGQYPREADDFPTIHARGDYPRGRLEFTNFSVDGVAIPDAHGNPINISVALADDTIRVVAEIVSGDGQIPGRLLLDSSEETERRLSAYHFWLFNQEYAQTQETHRYKWDSMRLYGINE